MAKYIKNVKKLLKNIRSTISGSINAAAVIMLLGVTLLKFAFNNSKFSIKL
jgi:hypothetical protein